MTTGKHIPIAKSTDFFKNFHRPDDLVRMYYTYPVAFGTKSLSCFFLFDTRYKVAKAARFQPEKCEVQ